jgi:hypothetical protein
MPTGSGLARCPDRHVWNCEERERPLAWLSPPLFDPGPYGCHKLFEGSLVYFALEPEIKVALKEFLKNLKQLLFPDATAPC